MQKKDIVVGGTYRAKVAGKLTTVRVDHIMDQTRWNGGACTTYAVTNLATGRETTFRSAAKFRSPAIQPQPTLEQVLGAEFGPKDAPADEAYTLDEDGNEQEDEQGSDPTASTAVATLPTAAPATTEFVQAVTEQTSASSVPPTALTAVEPDATTSLAAAFAAITKPARVRQHPLTDEQQAILDTVPNEQVLVLEAGAGCGKTFELVEIAEHLQGRGQYTAFNSSLVEDSKTKLPSHCPANTIHSLAFRQAGVKFKHRLNGNRMRASEVAALLGLEPLQVRGADDKPKTLGGGVLASLVARAVKLFCQSADRVIDANLIRGMAGVHADDEAGVRQHLLPYAVKMWEDVSNPNGRLPYAHDHYVKVWQLNTPIISADYVLLDEAQDTSPVMLDVLAQQARRGTKIILVGDSAQQIYTWRGATNALKAFPDAKRLFLSQSFRFGQVVAEVANQVLSHLEERTPLKLRGFDPIPSRLATVEHPDAVLCRTNAAAVSTLLTGIANGKRPHLIGGGAEVLAFVRGAQDLQAGRRTEHPELACFDSWNEVVEYSKTDEGEDLQLMCKLIKSFGADKIAGALRNMPEEKDANLVVCTAHKSKGREWHKVKLASDFMPLSKMGDEELRLLYVAATRAQHVLDVETCAPFCGGKEMDQRGEERRSCAIDLTEARRLSKLVGDNPFHIVAKTMIVYDPDSEEGKKQLEAAIKVSREIYDPPAKPRSNDSFSWTKGKNGDWLVRGPVGSKGVVKVARRNGSTSNETLVKVVWQDSEVALYEVAGR